MSCEKKKDVFVCERKLGISTSSESQGADASAAVFPAVFICFYHNTLMSSKKKYSECTEQVPRGCDFYILITADLT